MKMLIKTFAGLEEVLAGELEALGADDIEIRKRAVSCAGDQSLLYRANLWLRTGIRILVPLYTFEATDEHAIYDKIRSIDWSEHIHLDQTFAIDAVSQSSRFTHNHYLSLKTKDGIVDWFRDNKGKRPNVDTRDPHLRFHLHIDHNHTAMLLADSSGDGLHRRGYRTDGGAAPLNEALAAGMIKLSGWEPDRPFVDFMCGSGTILIEAGMMAAYQAPGLYRNFAFEEWRDFDHDLWEDIKQNARAARRPYELPIIGVDNNFKAIRIAENNIAAAHLESYVRVRRSSFQKYLPPEMPGTVVSNPPYGLRVDVEEDLTFLYSEIGDKLKKDFTGYQAWLLSGNMQALKSVGLRPSRKIPLMNGQLDCRFCRYDLYSGTKKLHKIKDKL